MGGMKVVDINERRMVEEAIRDGKLTRFPMGHYSTPLTREERKAKFGKPPMQFMRVAPYGEDNNGGGCPAA